MTSAPRADWNSGGLLHLSDYKPSTLHTELQRQRNISFMDPGNIERLGWPALSGAPGTRARVGDDHDDEGCH